MIKTRVYLAAMVAVTIMCGVNIANIAMNQPTAAEREALAKVATACAELRDSAFLASLGGMRADSPCGKVLGL